MGPLQEGRVYVLEFYWFSFEFGLLSVEYGASLPKIKLICLREIDMRLDLFFLCLIFSVVCWLKRLTWAGSFGEKGNKKRKMGRL